jgi:hypothetical protein
LAYTPELSDYHSATLRRIAWSLGKPMTKTIETVFDNLDTMIDPVKVCEKCKDRSKCESCYFNTGKRINEGLPIDPIKQTFNTEVEMKVNQVSVLVSKKVGKNFCSWSLSYGATAEVEEEHYTEAISQLDTQLKEMVAESLQTPNGNGTNHKQIAAE